MPRGADEVDGRGCIIAILFCLALWIGVIAIAWWAST